MTKLKKIDFLFLHVGRHLSDRADTLIMPMGLPMLADQLEKSGFKARVINLSLARLTDRHFSLSKIISSLKPSVICMSLHWHQQLPGVLNEARTIKRAFPGKKILLGGFTASFFAEDILALEPAVDFVIKGDAERPIIELARALESEKSEALAGVTNLCRRSDSGIINNPGLYTASSRDMNKLFYANLDLVLNRSSILEITGGCGLKYGRPLWPDIPAEERCTVFYSPGRGCPYSCSFCGGGRLGQAKINSRRKVVLKSVKSALNDIRGFLSYGVRHIHICFDPDPTGIYYAELFSEIKTKKLDFSLTFECWGLPSKIFLSSFASTFAEHLDSSRLVLSPESGSESVRRFNKKPFYSNAGLLAVLDQAQKLRIICNLSFAVGLPFETKEDFKSSVKLALLAKKLYGCWISISAIPIEPASPMYVSPRRYGLVSHRRGLKDYLKDDTAHSLGYSMPGFSDSTAAERIKIFRTIVKNIEYMPI